jgi:PAS domain S-box-containing protein
MTRPDGITILIFGEVNARSLIKEQLVEKKPDWRLYEAATFDEALKIREQNDFACAIFCDAESPASSSEIDQNSIAQSFFEAEPSIVVSAKDSLDAAVALMRAGAADFLLTKTLTAEKLIGAIEGAIERGAPSRAEIVTADALRESENILSRYKLISERARDIVLLLRLDGSIVEVNQAAIKIYGYTREEFLQKNLRDLRAPETLAALDQQLERANREGILLETVHLRKDGSPFPVEVSSGGTEINGERFLLSIIRDISVRKRTETALRRSEKRFAALVSASAQIVWTTDAAGKVIEDSPTWRDFTKQTYEEWKGCGWLDALHPDDRERAAEAWQKSLENQTPYEVDYRLKHHSGEYRWTIARAVPLKGAEGRIREWVGMNIDIHERRKAEELQHADTERAARIYAAQRDITNASADYDNLLHLILAHVTQLTAAEGASLEMLEGDELVYHAASGLAADFVGLRLKINKSLSGQCLTTGEMMRSDDAESDSRVDREAARRIGVGSMLMIPLSYDEKSLGVLKVMSSRVAAFGEREEKTLRLMSGFLGAVIARKQTEVRLCASEEFSRSVLESSPDCVKILDCEGRIEFMNENGALLLELDSFETVKNQLWQNFWSGNEQTESIRTIELASGGVPSRFQGFCPTMSGKPKWWDVIIVPVENSEGKIVNLLAVSRDITEQKRAQDALLALERRAADDYEKLLGRIVPLAEVIGTARELTPIYRAIGEFVRASMPCVGFFVSFYEPAKGLRIAAYAWSEGSELDVSNLPKIHLTKTGGGPNSRAIRTGKTVVVERHYMEQIKDRPHIVIGDDGKNPNSSIVVPMTVMGRIIGTIEVQAHENRAYTREHIVGLEMTANLAAVAIENVRLLESETALRREAEAVNLAKDEFLAVLSHELRTPLNAMLGWATLLKNDQITGDDARHAVNVIERNVRVQNTLIEDLLDVSRIITGKMRIEPEKIDFNQSVETAIETALPVAAKKHIEIEKVFVAQPSEINGDPHRLQQVVGNLLSNAVKFTPENGTIRLEISHAGENVRLVVSDTGIGIEPELLPQIFDRFSQADSSTKRKYGGLGLGLAIVRSLVEMHGGRVYAASDGEGKGSRFTIELPLIEPLLPLADPFRQLTAETATTATTTGDSQAKLLEGLRVLVVDDDRFALDMLQFVLKNHGALVTVAASGKEALAKFADDPAPDLLISDIGMAGMDGFDLIGEIRARQIDEKTIPAAALTAYASAEDRARALAAGFQIHIPKPIDIAQLPHTIARLAGQNQRTTNEE